MPLDQTHPNYWTEVLQFTANVHRDVYLAIDPSGEEIQRIAQGKNLFTETLDEAMAKALTGGNSISLFQVIEIELSTLYYGSFWAFLVDVARAELTEQAREHPRETGGSPKEGYISSIAAIDR
ncbi:unnamed protein product [Clonostachys chloroleuca]|uniref:Uncharacterized protein n=1 Tax=Clonostachys chloroleuca TaxID=1926264 RepID=A0AA35Q4S7_9HYPO|nr:unnamed protein product [Clonostachys chloroleuca]